jgi:uncharacterized protein (DUF342 family)
MVDTAGPENLTALAAELEVAATAQQVKALHMLAAAWQAERVRLATLSEQLATTEKRLEALEKDRQWWQDNAIKRRKRSVARKADTGD